MTTALRAPAPVRTSFVQQLRLIGWSGRPAMLLLGLLLFLVIVTTTRIDAALGLPPLLIAGMLALPAPAIWALVIWHGELPDRRAYHWSLPIPRPRHDLARVAAGAVWLIVAYLALAVVAAVVAATTGDWSRFPAIGSAWVTFFAGPLVLFLLISPFAIRSDSRWLRRGVVAFVALGMFMTLFSTVLDVEPYRRAMAAVFGHGWGLASVLFVSQGDLQGLGALGHAATTGVWLAIGIAATVVAVTWRPGDLARMVRGRRVAGRRPA